MLRIRQMKTLQKFSSVHAAFHNHFNQDRHLISRETYKAQRSAALAEWQTLAGQALRPLPYLRRVETSCRWTDRTATSFMRRRLRADQETEDKFALDCPHRLRPLKYSLSRGRAERILSLSLKLHHADFDASHKYEFSEPTQRGELGAHNNRARIVGECAKARFPETAPRVPMPRTPSGLLIFSGLQVPNGLVLWLGL
jgi:hypothetical protein